MAAGDLISRATLKARMETTEDESDDVLDAVITAASAAIRKHVGFDYAEALAATRTFPITDYTGELGTIPTPALREVTGAVEILDADQTVVATLAAGDVVLEPAGATVFDGVRLKTTADGSFRGNRYLRIVGTFGYATVPTHVEEACIATCRAMLRQDSVRWANAVELEDGRVVAPTPEGGWMLPTAAKQLLGDDRRRGIV